MKGKIITLIFMLCFLTGCDANYKLEYVNNTFDETLSINNLVDFEEEVKDVYNFDLSTNYLDISDYSKEEGLEHGYKYYNKNLSDDNGLVLSYQYDFKELDYENSQIGRMVFPNMSFNNNTLYSGNMSDIFSKYPDLENITIEFKTDKYIEYNNADKVEDNVLYWYIDKNNYNKKNVKITLSDDDNRDFVEVLKDKTQDIEDEEFDSFFKYVFIGFGFILIIVIFFVSIKFKNSNKK